MRPEQAIKFLRPNPGNLRCASVITTVPSGQALDIAFVVSVDTYSLPLSPLPPPSAPLLGTTPRLTPKLRRSANVVTARRSLLLSVPLRPILSIPRGRGIERKGQRKAGRARGRGREERGKGFGGLSVVQVVELDAGKAQEELGWLWRKWCCVRAVVSGPQGGKEVGETEG